MEAAEAKRQLMAAANSMRSVGSRKAFNAWRSNAEEAKETLMAMRRGASRFLNRELASAWTAWADQWREARDALAAMRRGASFMMNRELAGAWTSWKEVASDAAQGGGGLRRALAA